MQTSRSQWILTLARSARLARTRALFFILLSFMAILIVVYKFQLTSFSMVIKLSRTVKSGESTNSIQRFVETRDKPAPVSSKGWMKIRKIGLTKWQKISTNNDLIVYSAYYNNHKQYGPVIQAIVLKADTTSKSDDLPSPQGSPIQCKLLYPSERKGYYRVTTITSTNFYMWEGHHFRRYRPGHVCCRLPDDKLLPTAVSLTTENNHPLNQITISYEQLNTKSRRFTLCLSPLHFSTDVDKALVQYFEFNKLLGADYFFVYNTFVQQKTQKVLEFYAQQNNTRVIKWTLPPFLQKEDDIWYYGQTVALNDCYLRNKVSTKYLITSDLDEFILPRGSSMSWKDMLEKEPKACSYTLKCSVIDMQQQVSKIKNENRKAIAIKFNLFTLLHQVKHMFIHPTKVKSKVIVRTDCYDGVNVHTPMTSPMEESIPRDISYSNGLLYHYANPDANFLVKGASGSNDIDKNTLRFATDLIRNVASAWKKIVT